MKTAKLILGALFCLFVTSAFSPEQKVKIFMIGDSTMANKDISNGKLERGWGMMLKNFFSDDVVVDNNALNGRSSKSFITEGHWRKVVDQINATDGLDVEYYEIVDGNTLQPVDTWDASDYIVGCITVYCGARPVRLIDHIKYKN